MTKLKKIMFEKEIKQVQMAKDLGITPSFLSKIINGWILSIPETLKKQIAAYLKIEESKINEYF
jgi:DNA-binding Xre family transcriptional regulator